MPGCKCLTCTWALWGLDLPVYHRQALMTQLQQVTSVVRTMLVTAAAPVWIVAQNEEGAWDFMFQQWQWLFVDNSKWHPSIYHIIPQLGDTNGINNAKMFTKSGNVIGFDQRLMTAWEVVESTITAVTLTMLVGKTPSKSNIAVLANDGRVSRHLYFNNNFFLLLCLKL